MMVLLWKCITRQPRPAAGRGAPPSVMLLHARDGRRDARERLSDAREVCRRRNSGNRLAVRVEPVDALRLDALLKRVMTVLASVGGFLAGDRQQPQDPDVQLADAAALKRRPIRIRKRDQQVLSTSAVHPRAPDVDRLSDLESIPLVGMEGLLDTSAADTRAHRARERAAPLKGAGEPT